MSVLYVWVRTDLESMNTGKACAQVAHAASQAAAHFHGSGVTSKTKLRYQKWENSAGEEGKGIESIYTYGFGTTIVLDGGTGKDLRRAYDNIDAFGSVICGLITDPSYPVRDGGETWGVIADTCAWAFVDSETDPDAVNYIKQFKLR